MSYDIRLVDPHSGESLDLDKTHHMKGGVYAIGGTTEAWLNVTYNYAPFFYQIFGDDGIRILYGKTGRESIPLLEDAIARLGDDVTDDYWGATEGNAKQALTDLLELAKMCPEGVWQGD